VRTAFREALCGRPGPVHLDVPQDVLVAEFEVPDDTFDVVPERYRAVAGPRPAAALVAAAAAALRGARRPLIVAGGGVIASGAHHELRRLADRLQAPVVPTQMALGVVASDSPHFIGHGGLIAGDAVRAAFARADVVLSVGCRHSSWMWDEGGPFVRTAATHVNVNVDASALGAAALHHLGLQADARAALVDLLDAIGEAPVASEPDWLPSARAACERHAATLATMAAETTTPMHPAALAAAIARALPDDALVVFDGGHTTFWSNDLTPVHDVRTRFHDPGMAHLGFGLPYVLALKLARPRHPVVLITGDGSFGFTLQELDTARRHGLPVVVLIHNNASWGIIRAGQRKQFDFESATDLEGSDYAAIARGFGCHGETVTAPVEVAPALARAVASGRPAVIDCRVAFVPHPCMPGFAAMNRFGFAG